MTGDIRLVITSYILSLRFYILTSKANISSPVMAVKNSRSCCQKRELKTPHFLPSKSAPQSKQQKLSVQHIGDINRVITMSMGVSLFTNEDTVMSFVRRADECLYAAKDAGRNKVIVEKKSMRKMRRQTLESRLSIQFLRNNRNTLAATTSIGLVSGF